MNQRSHCAVPATFSLPPGGIPAVGIILLVEDEPTMQDLLVWLLSEEEHYSVLRSARGEDALALIEQQQQVPQALLLDYQLAGPMNGIELYDRLHARPGWQHVPAIIMSANLPEEAVRTRQLIGLAKPFDIDELLAHVAAAVGSSLACVQV